VLESDFSGTLTVDLTTPWPEVAARGILPLLGQIRGRAARVEWSFGDGTMATNLSGFTTHAWTNPGDYPVTFTAFNSDNSTGVATNLIIHVVALAALSLVAGLTESNFNFSFSGQPGLSYLIEQATNLSLPISWQSLGVISGTGTLQVLGSAPTNAMRFYRVGVP
jgi:PKD repeat protein